MCGFFVWSLLHACLCLVSACLIALLCDPVQISVWTGCGVELACVDGDDDGCFGILSTVTFESSVEETYYIFIGGQELFQTGNYQLFVASPHPSASPSVSPSLAPSASPTAAPFSVGCLSATPLNIDDMASGSTVESPEYSNQACGGLSEVLPLTRGDWYQVTGTGFPITVDSCSEGTEFNTIVSGGKAQHACVAFLLCLSSMFACVWSVPV